MKCDWCELEIGPYERPVRLSNTQPPQTPRGMAGAIAAATQSFSAIIRAASAEPEITLYFHPPCWRSFHSLLRGEP